MKQYDVIVVGSGAGGGITAAVLAEAGKHVLLLERGRSLTFEEVPRDHLRNQRNSDYGHNAGPDIRANPRVDMDMLGRRRVVRPHEGGYHNNAVCVGGGTRVYGAQAWRFMPQDFRMASIYGVPEDSSLADWPITYDELEPWYARAEREIGVSGDSSTDPNAGPRSQPFPMPPVASTLSGRILARAADKLGWSTRPVPLAINSEPYDGRAACANCSYCVGFACPVDAKNGSHNTVIPRALATGNCELRDRTFAEHLITDEHGKVVGVDLITESDSGPQRETVRAGIVVVSAGAVESARLLLNSTSSHHPAGIGNEHDQVGRHFQGHCYPGAFGIASEEAWDGIGPGPSIATTDFNHGNDGVVGGGMMANDFIKLPIQFWQGVQPPDLARWGAANKLWMRESYRRYLQIMGPVQDIPHPNGRVTVDPTVRDQYGLPVARFSGSIHVETLRTAEFMRQRAVEWLEAAGCELIWTPVKRMGLTGGQHQAGTCRMGNDPASSVTDAWGRVHAHDNLYVIDASLNVTNGGFNPVLTIMALAFRCSEQIAKTH